MGAKAVFILAALSLLIFLSGIIFLHSALEIVENYRGPVLSWAYVQAIWESVFYFVIGVCLILISAALTIVLYRVMR